MTEDKIVERLVRRIEQANIYFLKKIGASIQKIRELNPTEAHQLVQILKYGGNYDDIVQEISNYTNINIKEIDSIFSEYAKKDQQFSEQFYNYKNIPFVPYENNPALITQTMALSNIVKNEMYDFTRSKVLGYTIRDENGVPTFTGLKDTYNQLLDEALLNVGQGKETFDSAMSRILRDVGSSGLKTLEYESGRSVRLDSAVRMHLKGRLRELHNENQEIIGEEIGADGVEISVHSNPAPDHAEAQGRQFSIKEYAKLQEGKTAKDYKGTPVTLGHSKKGGYRPISEYNCYHYIYSIVLGVSEPEYSEEQLEEINETNDEGFEYEGQHYTNYQGTQLQRSIEKVIREQKDIQILAKASGNEFLAGEAQNKISILSRKYKELSNISGLPPKIKRITQLTKKYKEVSNKADIREQLDRARVSGYKHTKIVNIDKVKNIDEWQEYFGKKYGSFDILEGKVAYNSKLDNWVKIDNSLEKLQSKYLDKNINQIDNIYEKYNLKDKGLIINYKDKKGSESIAYAQGTSEISFTSKISNSGKLNKKIEQGIKDKFYMPVKKENIEIYPVTHELGHIIENRIMDSKGINTVETKILFDNKIKDELITNVMNKTKLNYDDVVNKYFSGYSKSQKNYEWFAESFTQYELGNENEWIKEFGKWIKKQKF